MLVWIAKCNTMSDHEPITRTGHSRAACFKRPDKAHVRAFAAVLEEQRVPVSIRVSRGMEAAAACGQLRNQHQNLPSQNFAVLT